MDTTLKTNPRTFILYIVFSEK